MSNLHIKNTIYIVQHGYGNLWSDTYRQSTEKEEALKLFNEARNKPPSSLDASDRETKCSYRLIKRTIEINDQTLTGKDLEPYKECNHEWVPGIRYQNDDWEDCRKCGATRLDK